MNKDIIKKSSGEEKAVQEEDRLERMMNRYFSNMNLESPIPDIKGVEQSIISNHPTESSSVKSQSNEIEVEEEEVFVIHPDGDITSEAEEQDGEETKIVYKQSIIDRTIYNLAIQTIYLKIQDYRELLDMAHDDMDKEYNVRSITQEIRTHEREIITDWLKELSETQFSLFKTLPSDDVLIDNIKNEELKKIVELEIERQIEKYFKTADT